MLEDLPEQLVGGTITAVVYGLIGVLLVFAGFKVFDWMTPKIDIQKELAENTERRRGDHLQRRSSWASATSWRRW